MLSNAQYLKIFLLYVSSVSLVASNRRVYLVPVILLYLEVEVPNCFCKISFYHLSIYLSVKRFMKGRSTVLAKVVSRSWAWGNILLLCVFLFLNF